MFFFDEEMIENKPNRTSIEQFTIKGLFGRNDVTLCFENEVNIYIGENGLGKTTILNCLYYILHDDYIKLSEITFNEIVVKFVNESKISISKADVLKYVKNSRRRGTRYREDDVYSYIESLLDLNNFGKGALMDDDLRDMITRRVSNFLEMPYSIANSYVSSYLSSTGIGVKGDERRINSLREIVSQKVKERVIYLTTYRRIEKDFSDRFESDNDRFSRMNDSLIRFGMKDVSKAIKNILETIRAKTYQGCNKMTGVLLSKYAKSNTSSYSYSNYDYQNYELVKIVLDRLGEQIDKDTQKTILELINKRDINNNEFQNLRDLIIELIQNYYSLKKYDEKIIRFTETCNKYLNNKRFVYNQSDLTLKILKTEDELFVYNSEQEQEEIELSMLSSGEKQIVSLFSRLYLESDNKCILLIDEPELSISMKWQKMLLPDIMRSGNCRLLLTVTHSPFIFDNEFDNDAKDMWYCFKNRGNI